MADQQVASIIDPMRNFSFDSPTLLTTSTINALHFPNLTTSGISDSGNGSSSRRTSLLLEGMGMFDSMTESFSSAVGQEELDSTNKIERKESNVGQKKRRSRKSQFDATVESPALEKIEAVTLIDDQMEADDVWWVNKTRLNEHIVPLQVISCAGSNVGNGSVDGKYYLLGSSRISNKWYQRQ